MKCVLGHTAATIWYMRHKNPREIGSRSLRASLAYASIPSDEVIRKLQWFLDLEDIPLDFLTDDPLLRRRGKRVCAHLCRDSLPQGSLIGIPSGIDDLSLYITNPELTFVHMAATSDKLDAIYAGMALCSDYRIEPLGAGGIVTRSCSDVPLTSVSRIERFLVRAGSLFGARKARIALPYVLEHSRSPKESGLAMFYGLPPALGGMKLGTVRLNPCIKVFTGRDLFGKPQSEERYPDILLTSVTKSGVRRDVAFDYDSVSVHEGDAKLLDDRRRANAIATVDSIVHYSITTSDLEDFDYLVLMGERARRVLKLAARPTLRVSRESEEGRMQLARFRSRQDDLWKRFVFKGPGY